MAESNEKPKSAESGSGKDKAGDGSVSNSGSAGSSGSGVSNSGSAGSSGSGGGNSGSVGSSGSGGGNSGSVGSSGSGGSDADGGVGGVSKDRVGDILKKERLTRRITVEAIAKDLKLNVGYIKALEAGDHASLPPEPYIRVYIKSLTKYLSLDTEAVLRDFDRERGLISDEYNKAANKIDISVQKPEKNMTLVITAALIVALAVFAFIANRKGWLATQEIAAAVEEIADTTTQIDADTLSDEADSTINMMGAPETPPETAKPIRAPSKVRAVGQP